MGTSEKMSKEFEALQKRYNGVLQEGVDALDAKFLRTLHSNFFTCGLKCTERNFESASKLQRCIQTCEDPVSKVQSNIQNELNVIQNRLQQCASECALKVKDGMPSNPTPDDQEKAEANMVKCCSNCVDGQIKTVLPQLFARLTKNMEETISLQQKLL